MVNQTLDSKRIAFGHKDRLIYLEIHLFDEGQTSWICSEIYHFRYFVCFLLLLHLLPEQKLPWTKYVVFGSCLHENQYLCETTARFSQKVKQLSEPFYCVRHFTM